MTEGEPLRICNSCRYPLVGFQWKDRCPVCKFKGEAGDILWHARSGWIPCDVLVVTGEKLL